MAYIPNSPKKRKESIKDQFLQPFQGLSAQSFKPDLGNVTGRLDKPIQAVNEFINPELKKARVAQETQRAQYEADVAARNAPASTQTATEPESVDVRPKVPEVIRDMDTGKVTGITFPDGRTITGLSEREVAGLLENFNAKQAPFQGTQEAGTARQQAEKAQETEQALGALSDGQLPAAQDEFATTPADTLATLGLGAPKILGAGVAGAGLVAGAAKAGGLIGTGVAPGAGTIAGIAIGGIVGGAVALLLEIGKDRKDTTVEAIEAFRRYSRTRNKQIINMANAGEPAPLVIEAYEQNLSNILATQRALQRQTRTATGRKLSNAIDELKEIQFYLDNETYYRQELLRALQAPNPAAIVPIQESLNSGEITN